MLGNLGFVQGAQTRVHQTSGGKGHATQAREGSSADRRIDALIRDREGGGHSAF